MMIGYTSSPGKGDTDLLLSELAERLAGRGLRLAGVVQTNTDCARGGPCDMDVRVLPGGPVLRISQSLGPNARGCRLDPDALERAVALVEAGLSGGADGLVVNKFGKHEAAGRGFRNAIGTALDLGIPVLVGLNGLNREAFDTFTGGAAQELPPDAEALEAWFMAHLGERHGARPLPPGA